MAKNISEPTGSNPVILPASSSSGSRSAPATPSGDFRISVLSADVQRLLRKSRRIGVQQETIPTQPEITSALLGSRGAPVLPTSVFSGPPEIEVTCPKWAAGIDADMVWLQINRSDMGGHPNELVWDGREEGETFPLDSLSDPMVLPLTLSVLGTEDKADEFFVLYVAQGSAFSDPYLSKPYHFEIDRRAPGGDSLVHPFIDPAVITNGLTENYLDANGGKLTVTVDPYDDQQPGDAVKALMRVVGSTGTPIETAPYTVVYDGEQVSLSFLKADLLSGGIDGRVELWLSITDIAGNVAESPKIQFNTLLANAPSGFTPIYVPLHDDNGNLITDTEARQNPVFYVPGYDNATTDDTVRVRVLNPDGTEFLFERIPVTDPTADPIVSGDLTYAELDLIRRSFGGNPVFSFKMDYRIEREPFVIETLQETTINCDLTIPGGPDPDPSTPINENLKPPTISGDNEISEQEFGNPVTTSIPFDAVDATPVFEISDAVQLFITDMSGGNRVPVNAQPVSVTVPNVNLDSITVPASMLVSGLMYFQYSISRVVTGGKLVTAWSPIQTVIVKSSEGLPGGGNPLPLDMSIFRDADQTKPTDGQVRPSYSYVRVGDTVSGAPNPYAGLLIRIHQYDNMAVGDEIEVTLQAGLEHPDYLTPDPALIWTLRHTVNEENMQARPTRIPEDALPTTMPPINEPAQFVDFKVPYQELLKLDAGLKPGVGTMRISYKITNAQGPNSSDPAVIRFATIDARFPG